MTAETVQVFIDGGARGNPGEAGCGIVLRFGDGRVEEHMVYLGPATNNAAEYAALLAALERALALGVDAVDVRSDSELLVKQMTGSYRVRAAHLRRPWLRAQELSRRFAHFRIAHIPRTANANADRLANLAMDGRTSTLRTPRGWS